MPLSFNCVTATLPAGLLWVRLPVSGMTALCLTQFGFLSIVTVLWYPVHSSNLMAMSLPFLSSYFPLSSYWLPKCLKVFETECFLYIHSLWGWQTIKLLPTIILPSGMDKGGGRPEWKKTFLCHIFSGSWFSIIPHDNEALSGSAGDVYNAWETPSRNFLIRL